MSSSRVIKPGKKQEAKASRWPWLFWLCAILGGAMWWLLYNSTYFVATDIKVVGNSRVSTEKIIATANVQLNIPLIKVQTANVHSLFADFPEFKSITVARGWPHTVLITVDERAPVASAQVGTKYVLIDELGEAASKSSATPQMAGVPIIGKPGTPAMQAGVSVLRALPTNWKVKAVVANTQDSVEVSLAKGVTIVFGSGERVEYKVKVANALLANKYTDINVSAPDAPTVR